MGKKFKRNTSESHQITRQEKKETERNYKNNQKTINKMAINTYYHDYFKCKWTKFSSQKT